MHRRDFLKTCLGTALTLTSPDGMSQWICPAGAADKTDIVVARGTPPAGITRAAIDGLGGIGRFISRGDIVVVKPNIGWDRPPEYAANTNPEVVATVVRLCYEAGARKVKVFDHPVNDARRCYKQSGIADAATAVGGVVTYIDDRRFRDMQINGATTDEVWTHIVFFGGPSEKLPVLRFVGCTSPVLGLSKVRQCMDRRGIGGRAPRRETALRYPFCVRSERGFEGRIIFWR